MIDIQMIQNEHLDVITTVNEETALVSPLSRDQCQPMVVEGH